MKVVVGTDGSAGALEAMRWALDLCDKRADPDDEIEFVHVYSAHDLAMPLFAPTSVSGPGPYLADRPGSLAPLEAASVARGAELGRHFHHDAEQLLANALHDVGGARAIRVKLSALPGSAHGRGLVEHADGADLLVVGARGQGSIVSHVLGSVSSYCANHAHCPVVVVRH